MTTPTNPYCSTGGCVTVTRQPVTTIPGNAAAPTDEHHLIVSNGELAPGKPRVTFTEEGWEELLHEIKTGGWNGIGALTWAGGRYAPDQGQVHFTADEINDFIKAVHLGLYDLRIFGGQA